MFVMSACASPETNPTAAKFPQVQSVVRLANTWGVVVPLSSASAMLHLCRSTGGAVDSFWTPTVQEIEVAERGIEAYVGAHPPPYRLDPDRQTEWSGAYMLGFGRQYVGVTRGTTRFLLINVFETARHTELADRATRQVIQICDGGSNFITVEFNETLGQFSFIDYGGTG